MQFAWIDILYNVWENCKAFSLSYGLICYAKNAFCVANNYNCTLSVNFMLLFIILFNQWFFFCSTDSSELLLELLTKIVQIHRQFEMMLLEFFLNFHWWLPPSSSDLEWEQNSQNNCNIFSIFIGCINWIPFTLAIPSEVQMKFYDFILVLEIGCKFEDANFIVFCCC